MKKGFSLTEVLLAVGILAVGMVLIAGVFPVAIHFTTIATERTIAAIVSDEAFAKIKIYAVGELWDPCDNIILSELAIDKLRNFNDVSIFPATAGIKPDEFTYPSTDMDTPKQYCWSALCRRVDTERLVQVTVFASRKVGSHLKYPDSNGNGVVNWPTPVKVEVSNIGIRNDELRISKPAQKTFINDGYTIVDDRTGRIYRVLERYADEPDTILLDRNWDERWRDEDGEPIVIKPKKVWVVPPPVNGSKCPCIVIYQKVIRF